MLKRTKSYTDISDVSDFQYEGQKASLLLDINHASRHSLNPCKSHPPSEIPILHHRPITIRYDSFSARSPQPQQQHRKCWNGAESQRLVERNQQPPELYCTYSTVPKPQETRNQDPHTDLARRCHQITIQALQQLEHAIDQIFLYRCASQLSSIGSKFFDGMIPGCFVRANATASNHEQLTEYGVDSASSSVVVVVRAAVFARVG